PISEREDRFWRRRACSGPSGGRGRHFIDFVNLAGQKQATEGIAEGRESHNSEGKVGLIGKVSHHSFKSRVMPRPDKIDDDFTSICLGIKRPTALLKKRVEGL